MGQKITNLWTAIRQLKLQFNKAGLICIMGETWSLHFLVKYRYWTWGFDEFPYMDRPMGDLGFGPFFHYVWERTES